MSIPVWSKNEWKSMNTNKDLPKTNNKGELIVIGCNYHTNWQSNSQMRFVLTEIKNNQAKLQTRRSRKTFWTNIDDLIFIKSNYNKQKAKELRIINN